MMTKVRGGKGFDALFSRFFDEPGLKSAVDSLHDNFSASESDHPSDTPAHHSSAKRAPAAAKKPVAAPVAAVKPPVKKKSAAPKLETVPEAIHQEHPQDFTPAQSGSLLSEITGGWSIELLEELTEEIETEQLETEQMDDLPQQQTIDQLPVIDVDEPVLADAVEVVHDGVDIDDLQFEDFFSRKSGLSHAPVAPSAEVHETVVVPVAPPVEVHETAAAPVASAVEVHETVVVPVAPVVEVHETVVFQVAPAVEVLETVVVPVAPVVEVHEAVDTPPVAPAVEVHEVVVAPVALELLTPAAPVTPVDSDDRLIEEFFSRKVKPGSHAPVVADVAVRAPVVDPVTHEYSTPAALVSPAVTEDIAVPQKTAVQVEKSLSEILVHPQAQLQDLSSQARRRPLTENQGRILVYLYEIARGCANVDTISRELDIDCHTVRESLLVLVTDGYLYLLDKIRASRVHPAGFSYRMNNYLCSRYAARVREGGDLLQDQPLDETIWQTERPAAGVSTPPLVIFSSSVAKEKETAADLKGKKPATVQPAVSGVVSAFWEKEGLEEPLVQKWCSLFGIEAEQMHQQLEWARFDLETNKRRETVKKDVISWFYDRLMITGGIYPRPSNYRSAEELRVEAMQQQHESDLSAQAKIVEIEFENSLQSFLADTEAPLYQELLGRVNSFALEQLRTGEGKAEEIGLDALFKLHWGAPGSDPANPTVSFALSGLGAGQSNKPISLAAGWNLVGYDAAYSQPVVHAISSIATLIVSIWGWNNGQWLSYAPTRSVNSLTTLEPGTGYWIKMKQPAVWTLP